MKISQSRYYNFIIQYKLLEPMCVCIPSQLSPILSLYIPVCSLLLRFACGVASSQLQPFL